MSTFVYIVHHPIPIIDNFFCNNIFYSSC